MASGSQYPVGRSGGKILKSTRTAARKTPYDRPISPQPQPALLQSESPSWLSGLVSPAKFVAGGATKILSSFWNPKSWGTPSSSSSESDSESEDDSGDDENPSDGQQKGNSSQKIETLHLIEQLLMLEQFSREECDRLIEIINSRVVRNDTDAGPSKIHNSINNETNDLRNQAIMEARKWVAENNFRSGLKSDLDNGNYGLKSVMTPQVNEGSPIDVAKSYMKARPAWASPIDYDKSLTQSPSDLIKERTPISSSAAAAGISFSSAKKDYLSAGSWNIQEEIRRVRTKATEDMLNSHRALKHSLIYETPKSVDETVDLTADEMNRNEENESKKEEDKRNSDEEYTTQTVKICYLMTESQDIMENSQDSSDGHEQLLDTKEVTPPVGRGTRVNRRGRGRGKGRGQKGSSVI